MDALILSCSTGGGHNAAGAALREELEARGHRVTMMDPYELVSHKLAQEIANVYVKMVQRSPKLFGMVYYLGSLVRHVPGKSPVYFANIAVAKKLREYLAEHPADVILMPHLYPAELVTYLKRQGEELPLTVFVATDYVCIPFTEETDCDYYVVPGERQLRDFMRWKIPRDRLLPYGIPVSRAFDEPITKLEARRRLGLSTDLDKKYILLTGGSIGAGDIHSKIRVLLNWLKKMRVDGKLIVVCGNNERLYSQLEREYVTSDSWKQKLGRYAGKYASAPGQRDRKGRVTHASAPGQRDREGRVTHASAPGQRDGEGRVTHASAPGQRDREGRVVQASALGQWDGEGRVILLRRTREMALYMRACDLFLSKPGGLSSTEAAVAQVPYIQIRPIPGCETYNMRYFTKNGMSIGVKKSHLRLSAAVGKLWKPENVEKMLKKQREGIPQNARKDICDWLERRLCL